MDSFESYQPSSSNAMKQKTTKAMKKGEPSTPLFLRKTFDMISTCDTTLASWYDEGTTFVVKEPERFASEIIPAYFKHSNFSSFVRQLNFYGFRKIKADPLRLSEAAASEESNYWKFGHRAFQKGRPDLLPQIKKDKDKNESSIDKQEIDQLKKDNEDMKRKLSAVTGDVERLSSMVQTLLKNKAFEPPSTTNWSSKKRRLVQGDTMSEMSSHSMFPPVSFDVQDIQPHALRGPNGMDDGSVGSVDADLLLSLFDFDAEAGALDKQASANVANTTNPVDSALVEKLRDTLSKLPKNMQEMFVNRMVGAVSNPEDFQRQVDAVTSLAMSAAKTAHCHAQGLGQSVDDKRVSSLGSAVLQAYLAQKSSEPDAFQAVTPPPSPPATDLCLPTRIGSFNGFSV